MMEAGRANGTSRNDGRGGDHARERAGYAGSRRLEGSARCGDVGRAGGVGRGRIEAATREHAGGSTHRSLEEEGLFNMSEAESLRADIALSRSIAVDLLVEIDDIRLRQIPIIAAEYEVKIGCWQAELLRAQIAVRRAKRKLELARVYVNRGEEVDTVACEKQLDEELREWHDKLVATMARYKEAIGFKSNLKPLSNKKFESVKSLYRKLAKRLHPDLHPGNREAAELFLIANQAYEGGDFAVLESLEVATRNFESYGEDDTSAMSIEEMQVELEICEAHVAVLMDQIAEIKRSRPYCYKSMLEDPVAIDREARNYQKKIEACRASEREFAARLKELLR